MYVYIICACVCVCGGGCTQQKGVSANLRVPAEFRRFQEQVPGRVRGKLPTKLPANCRYRRFQVRKKVLGSGRFQMKLQGTSRRFWIRSRKEGLLNDFSLQQTALTLRGCVSSGGDHLIFKVVPVSSFVLTTLAAYQTFYTAVEI